MPKNQSLTLPSGRIFNPDETLRRQKQVQANADAAIEAARKALASNSVRKK